MAEKKLIMLAIFFSLMIISGAVLAQDLVPPDNIIYPVKELGNCKSEKDCGVFCDKPQNAEVCVNFAVNNGMIKPEEAEIAKKMLSSIEGAGPGGCKGKDECESYCEDIDHIEECVAFAEQYGFLPPEELAEAKAVASAIKKGVNPPGGCKSKSDCDAYCDNEENIEECVAFGEAAGFIKPEEAQMIKKTGGKGPGGCKGREQCDSYCQASENMEICINFAIEHDLIPSDEKEDAIKTLDAIKKGVRPPNCRGKDECDNYCSQPEHAEECVEFGIAAGFIPPEEAEQVRKMAKAGIMGGPGGCKGKAECEAFCDQPEHMVECVDFAEKAGFMPPEEAARARKMAEKGIMGGPGGCKGQEQCEAYCGDPSHGEECMKFAVENGFMTQEEFEGAQKMMQGGPGGCRGEECRTYCDDPSHQEECFKFAKENNLIPPEELERMEQGREMMQEGGPGGCRGEECRTYCGDPSHGEECMKWAQEKGMMPMGQPMEGGEGMMPPQGGIPPNQMIPPEGMMLPEGGWQGGQPPEGWQGQMPPEGFQPPPGYEGQIPPEGMMPPEGYKIPEGMTTPPEGYQIPEGMMPPENMMPPQEFNYPQEYVPPSNDYNTSPPAEYTPPPEYIPPPTTAPTEPLPPPPTSFIDSFLGIILYPITLIFQ